MIRFGYYRRGFTLIELLLAALIMVLVVGGAISVYLMAVTAWKEGSVQIALQREGSLAMEKMVRGVDGTHGIREAVPPVLISNNNHKIEFTSKDDGTTRAFNLVGTELKYYPDSTDLLTSSVIAEDVVGLDFTGTDVITINLGLQDRVRGKDINVNLSTKVKLRN